MDDRDGDGRGMSMFLRMRVIVYDWMRCHADEDGLVTGDGVKVMVVIAAGIHNH